MKGYRKKEEKDHLLAKLILEIIIVFLIATMSIVLYDTYANIEVQNERYVAERVSKEVNTKSTEDVSSMLEEVSKSVVRHIKNWHE